MWLITDFGFFSIVQKKEDVESDTLTVRARVRTDLEMLRDKYLPGLGLIQESKSNDYRFRAVAPRAEVATAMAAAVQALHYSNFKSQVAKVQGVARAHLYHDVWEDLYRLQLETHKYDSKSFKAQKTADPVYHPCKDDHGKRVALKHPSQPSSLLAWKDPAAIACVIPEGQLPQELNGIAFVSCTDLAESVTPLELVSEPPFKVPAGYKMAAGVVVREPDGRVWVVAPSNAFGGYEATFPKGTLGPGQSTQAAALREALEEAGLQVRLLQHLVDVKRSQSYTRYFLAERLSGSPADMGWESQAVMLVPQSRLLEVLNNGNDVPIVEALLKAVA